MCDAYRFHNFEARVQTGSLLRDGQKVKIEELPFQMLLVLLERAGQVVTKEELRDRLWGEHTFGEFDNSLHVAAAKLREALRESSGGQRFIETVRRRGYQFIGEVVSVHDAPAALPTPPSTVAAEELYPPKLDRLRLWPVLASVGLLAIIVSLGLLAYHRAHLPLVRDGESIVIGGFANETGDDSYGGLAHAFRVKLEESPYLSIVPDRRLRSVVSDPDSATLQEQLNGCASLGGKLLLTGGLAAEENGYLVMTITRLCSDGRLVDTHGYHAGSREQILSTLSLAAEQLRRRLGESDASLQRFNVPLEQATTASPAALKAFTLGEEKRVHGHEFESIDDYKLATDLDPQFALAYARLGTIYSNAAESSVSGAYYKKAFEMRDRTTDRERLYIAAHYYGFATGEIQRSIDAFELWHTLYPRDASPAHNLAIEYLSLGEPDKAEQIGKVALRSDPSSSFTDAVMARVYLENQDYKDLKPLCRDLGSSQHRAITLHEACYLFAFLQGDEASMQRELQTAREDPAGGELLDEAGWVAMYRGKIAEAHERFTEARQIALANNFVEMAATVDLDEAGLEADLGYPVPAKQHLLDALHLAGASTTTEASAALALARIGEIRESQSEAASAAKQAPTDTILNAAELASVRAAIAMERHQPSAAVEALVQARPYDFVSTMSLGPAYYRGLAYLQGDRSSEAAGEFHRVIDHKNLAPDSPYIALAELNLGRALERSGDREHAAIAYQDAANLWKDADPDFIPLRQLQCLRHSLDSSTGDRVCGHS